MFEQDVRSVWASSLHGNHKAVLTAMLCLARPDSDAYILPSDFIPKLSRVLDTQPEYMAAKMAKLTAKGAIRWIVPERVFSVQAHESQGVDTTRLRLEAACGR